MAMSETYFIDGRISQQGHMLACPKCGRKILVEIALNGVSHNVSVVAICAECMVVEDAFARDYPDIAARLREWAASNKDVEQLSAELDTLSYPGDWPEDFEHENGNYFCQCAICKATFRGHKRRVCCKRCADVKTDATVATDAYLRE